MLTAQQWDAATRRDEKEVVHVFGWHHLMECVEERELVALDVELRERNEYVASNCIPIVAMLFQEPEGFVNGFGAMPLLDLDKHRGTIPAQQLRSAAEDSRLVAFYVALNERDALLLRDHLVETLSDYLVGPLLEMRTCSRVAERTHAERRAALHQGRREDRHSVDIGEGDGVQRHVPPPSAEPSQPLGVLRVRLEEVHMAAWPHELRQPLGEEAPARANVEDDLAALHQFLDQLHRRVALRSSTAPNDAGMVTRTDFSDVADADTDRIHGAEGTDVGAETA